MTIEQRLTQSTTEERASLLAAGMQEIAFPEFIARLAEYGYKVETDCCLSYINRGNSRTYRARSLAYADIETGLSFAHFNGRRDTRFRQLQNMRRECFVFRGGRIYEL